MIESIAAEAPPTTRLPLQALLRPRLTDRVLDRLGDRAKFFDVQLHSTASATVLLGGHARTVIPGEVSVDLDCRLLPGFEPDDVCRELRALAGDEMDFDVVRYDPGPPAPDMALFQTLSEICGRSTQRRGGRCRCSSRPSATRASSLGSGLRRTAGPPRRCVSWSLFTPDERIPVDALDFGTRAITQLLARFGNATP